MKASELVKQYQQGKRDFRGVNLTGQSFKGQDLSGADFSDADLEGTNFNGAILRGVNFRGMKGGRPKRWSIILLRICWLISAISGFFLGFIAYFGALVFDSNSLEQSIVFTWMIILLILSICQSLIVRLLKAAKEAGIFIFVLAIVIGLEIALAFVIAFGFGGTEPLALFIFDDNLEEEMVAFMVMIVFFIFFSISIYKSLEVRLGTVEKAEPLTLFEELALHVFTSIDIVIGIVILWNFFPVIPLNLPEPIIIFLFFSALISAVALPYAVVYIVAFPYAQTVVITAVVIAIFVASALGGVLGGVLAFVLTVTSALFGRLAVKQDSQSSWINKLARIFAFIGVTSFYNADLTDADFTGAMLKNTDLRAKSMIRTCWKDSIKLENARVDQTLLAQAEVRELLVTGYGYQKSYLGADLRGANLVGANLREANLKWADLSKATLAVANLNGANLSRATVMETDFTRARMTGACLEAWNTNSKTKLEQVECQYVYLREKPRQGSDERERQPSSGNFQAGEFTELVEKISNLPKSQEDADDWWFDQ